MGVLASIVNTHYLDPAEYGDVRYVQNIINFISIFLLFGYFVSGSRLLALSENEQHSRKIRGCMVLILGVASIFLMLLTGINCLFHPTEPEVSLVFLVSIPICMEPLLLNYLNTTAQGDNHIGRLALTRLLPSLIYVPIAYLVYSKFGSTPVLMVLLQWGIAVIILSLIVISTKPSFKDLKPVFHELRKENQAYGIHVYWGEIAKGASAYLAGIFLGLFNTDNTNVGFYTLALTVTSPLIMLPTIMGTAYFKKFAVQSKIPTNVFKATVLMSSFTCIGFILLIQPIVTFLYSESYSMVGIYASWLAVGFTLQGIGDMITRFLGSHGQGKPVMVTSFICCIIRVFGFVVLVYYFNILGALVTLICSTTTYFISILFYYKKYIKQALSKY